MVRPLNSYVPEMLPRIEYEAQYQKSETRSEVSFQSDYNPSIEIFPRLDHIYSVVNLYKCLSQPFRHGKFFSAEPLRKSQIWLDFLIVLFLKCYQDLSMKLDKPYTHHNPR